MWTMSPTDWRNINFLICSSNCILP